jgi:hypothetical protein
VPLRQLIVELEAIPDLHTRIAALRLAHAEGLLRTDGRKVGFDLDRQGSK